LNRLDFFDIDVEYINFLKRSEEEVRGFSRVPDVIYHMQNGTEIRKFMCGVAFERNGFSYFVPVSSKVEQNANSFVLFDERDIRPIKGTLRFNYMFPAPPELASRRVITNEAHLSYQKLLFSELEIVRRNMDRILEIAEKTYYQRVGLTVNPGFAKNSCDFLLLEKKCQEYCVAHHLPVPGERSIVEIYQQEFRQHCYHREYDGSQEELIRHLEKETKSLIFPKGDKYLVAIHEASMSRAMQLEELYLNPPSRERHQVR